MVDVPAQWRTEADQLARSFWRWWSGELIALVPLAMRRALAGWSRRPVLMVDSSDTPLGYETTLGYETAGRCEMVGPFDLSIDEPTQASALLSPGKVRAGRLIAARLRLAPTLALHLPMTLPLAAQANLGQVVEFEFERFSPFKRDAVYFSHRITARDADGARLDVELVVVQRDTIDEFRRQAERNGLRITGIEVGAQRLPLPSEAVGDEYQPVSGRFVPLAVNILLALAGLLAIGLVVVPYFRDNATISELTAEVAQAKREADASAKVQDAIDGEIHDQSFVIDRKQSGPTVTELMASLTHILPDDVWLTELEIDGDNVQLSGFAGSATAVLGLLDQSPMLANAAFRSSVTQETQLSRERFDITAQVRRKTQP
jgi:general secretion pathway protein L